MPDDAQEAVFVACRTERIPTLRAELVEAITKNKASPRSGGWQHCPTPANWFRSRGGRGRTAVPEQFTAVNGVVRRASALVVRWLADGAHGIAEAQPPAAGAMETPTDDKLKPSREPRFGGVMARGRVDGHQVSARKAPSTAEYRSTPRKRALKIAAQALRKVSAIRKGSRTTRWTLRQREVLQFWTAPARWTATGSDSRPEAEVLVAHRAARSAFGRSTTISAEDGRRAMAAPPERALSQPGILRPADRRRKRATAKRRWR